ncbi:MAG: hypothetical protein EA392_15100 [Cryomorphaceae bacterium]|nr:MAG: hypothetical protein EA392_15100 [Cryomorphaceae bacterium]
MRRLKIVTSAIALLFFLTGCEADRRVNYKQHPELRQAKKDFGSLYEAIVEAGNSYYRENDALHEYLLRQTSAMYRTRYLMADSTLHYFPELTSASTKEVFEEKYKRMMQEQLDRPAQPDDGSTGPVLNWAQLYPSITTELERRNKRVREMRAGIEAAKADTLAAPAARDTTLPGFSVMPTR